MSHSGYNRAAVFACLLLVLLAATVLGALAAEHIGGMIPCALCLQERIPYYISVVLMGGAVVLALGSRWPAVLRLLFIAVFLLMAADVGLSAYHAGVEWGWWAGPAGCSGHGMMESQDAQDLFATFDEMRPVPCDTPALVIFGLSMAGWNAVTCFVYAAFAFAAAFILRRQR